MYTAPAASDADGSVPRSSRPTTSASDERFCLGCDYSLTGLTEPRCPECDRAFDPLDARTFHTRPLGRVARALCRPPGLLLNAAVLGAALLTCASVSAPGGYFNLSIVSALVWYIVGPIWLVCATISLVLTLRGNRPAEWKRYGRRMLLGPIVVLVLLAAVGLRIPYWATFWSSRPFMDALAEQARASDQTLPTPRFIGLYPVSQIERVRGGVKFYVAGAGFLSDHGFLYREQPLPTDKVSELWIPRPGNWVEFQEIFMGPVFR